MELTEQERQITANLLSQISVPVKDAKIVLEIIAKLLPRVGEKEPKKE